MKSVYDLAVDFMHHFITTELSINDKKNIITNLKSILSRCGSGLTYEIVSAEFDRIKKQGLVLSIEDILSIPKVVGRPVESNLINQNRFYLHPELRITPPPPVVEIDIDSGDIKRIVEEYYLEIVASYTLSDLTNYYMTKKEMLPQNVSQKRIKGSMKYLLNKFDLEVILFMIESAHYDTTSYNKKAILVATSIEDYYAEARCLYEQSKTQAKESGDDRIVPKKRTIKPLLPYRNRTCMDDC